jgi:hypothetical protein
VRAPELGRRRVLQQLLQGGVLHVARIARAVVPLEHARVRRGPRRGPGHTPAGDGLEVRRHDQLLVWRVQARRAARRAPWRRFERVPARAGKRCEEALDMGAFAVTVDDPTRSDRR